MSIPQAVVLQLAAALVLANLPFLRASSPGRDALGWLAAYGLWMGLGLTQAAADGMAAPASWELWAISVALFAVLAFPGIVCRYLART